MRGACTICHEYPEGSACTASGCPGRPFNKTPAPHSPGSDNASGTNQGHAAEVTSDGGITGFISRRESMAMAYVAAGFTPSPSPHWPFRYFADPRQPVSSGDGLALAQLHGGMPLDLTFHSEVANT